ncbi:MAG: PEFG-CTERM sorting domain-containing protein, partial [Candidatus Nitrosotenuis sp.]|nr:PEFG-CTERM sorting domain-containing protein [Candidatus Nitrosotenuis sp.]
KTTNPATHTADVTVTTEQSYQESDSDGNDVTFGVKSYYDKVSDFDYDPVTSTVVFEMPFDWSERNISHVPVVHEEVHFPKNFAGFVVPSYVGKVNGIELFKSSVTIDDYSDEEDRIVHFVLSQDNLKYLKQVQKTAGIENPQNLRFSLEVSHEIVFPAIALTGNEEIQVDLSWDPVTIEPEKNTKFIYTFRNAKTGEPLRNTSYDLVLLQNGGEVYRRSGMAQIGGDYTDYTFSKEETGYTSIRFENIRGLGQSTEFVVTVVPEFGPLALVILSASVMATLIIGRRSVFRF